MAAAHQVRNELAEKRAELEAQKARTQMGGRGAVPAPGVVRRSQTPPPDPAKTTLEAYTAWEREQGLLAVGGIA